MPRPARGDRPRARGDRQRRARQRVWTSSSRSRENQRDGTLSGRAAPPRADRDRRGEAALAVGRRPAAGRGSGRACRRLRARGAAAVSILVDERFGGTWDDLRAARAPPRVPLLAKGFFSTEEDLRSRARRGRRRGAAAPPRPRRRGGATAARRRRRARAGRRSSRRTTREELDARGRARRAGDRDQRPRPVDVRDRPRGRSSSSSRERREIASSSPRAGSSRARRAPRRSSPARTRSSSARRSCARPIRRRSSRSSVAAARQGLRADARGRRRRGGRGRSGPGRLRPRRREPAPRAERPARARDDALGRGRASVRPGEHGADLVQLYPREAGKVRGRDAVLLRDGERGRAGRRSPLGGRRPDALRASARGGGSRHARRRASAPRTSRAADRAVRPWAVDASSRLESRAGRQRPRSRARLRRGGHDDRGALYGAYGGRYVPETLIPALDELERGWEAALADASFRAELDQLGERYVGRPTPLYETERFAPAGDASCLKREDLCHTGAHKINNALGQILLAVAARQAADRRRDRRGPARRRDGDRLREVRARVRRLHGLRGHAPPASERRAHAPAGRRGAGGRVRDEDAEGGDERGDPRLDRERRDDVLPHRILRRAASVSRRSCASCRP